MNYQSIKDKILQGQQKISRNELLFLVNEVARLKESELIKLTMIEGLKISCESNSNAYYEVRGRMRECFKDNAKLRKAYRYKCSERQLLQVVRECRELTKATLKHLNRGHDLQRVGEELADVETVMDQIKIYLSAKCVNYAACQENSVKRLRANIDRVKGM